MIINNTICIWEKPDLLEEKSNTIQLVPYGFGHWHFFFAILAPCTITVDSKSINQLVNEFREHGHY